MVATPRTIRALKANGRSARSLRLAKSPRGLFDHVEPMNARRLLLAAMTAFANHGYHGTTTREIAAIAGLSPAALYTHYPTKAAIFYEISLVGHDYILMLTRQAVEGTTDPEEKVARMVRASVTYHAEEVTLTRVVNAEFRGALQKNQLATIRKIRHEISSVVREVLEEGVASGVFKVNNVHGATIALLRLVDVSSWFNPAAGMSPEELADVFVDLSLAMLRATDTP
jgi:AcrR family transcriptional regulator